MTTRGEIITEALLIVGDPSRTSEAALWLNWVLYELESLGHWRFLETETTYQTETGVGSVLFSANKWPAAALTDFSKGMSVFSGEGRNLLPVSKSDLDEMNDGTTGNPRVFSLWNETLYLYPEPITNFLPLLTIKYYQEITVPTSDADDMETVSNIKPKYSSLLIAPVAAMGLKVEDDDRDQMYTEIWLKVNLPTMMKDNMDFFRYRDSKDDLPVRSVKGATE